MYMYAIPLIVSQVRILYTMPLNEMDQTLSCNVNIIKMKHIKDYATCVISLCSAF